MLFLLCIEKVCCFVVGNVLSVLVRTCFTVVLGTLWLLVCDMRCVVLLMELILCENVVFFVVERERVSVCCLLVALLLRFDICVDENCVVFVSKNVLLCSSFVCCWTIVLLLENVVCVVLGNCLCVEHMCVFLFVENYVWLFVDNLLLILFVENLLLFCY